MIGLQPTSVGARAVRYLRSIEDPNEWVFTIPLAYLVKVENAKTLPVLLKHVLRLGLVEKRRRRGQKQAEWRARSGSWDRDAPDDVDQADEPDPVAAGNSFLRTANWPPGFVSQWDALFQDMAGTKRRR